MVRMRGESSRGVGEGDHILLELQAEFWYHEDSAKRISDYQLDVHGCWSSPNLDLPKRVASDTDETIGTQLCRERRGILQSVVDERCELESILVCVIEPRSTRQRHDGRRSMNIRPEKLGRLRSEKAVVRSKIS